MEKFRKKLQEQGLKKPDWVLFDYGGTLVYEGAPDWQKGVNELYKSVVVSSEITPEEYCKLLTQAQNEGFLRRETGVEFCESHIYRDVNRRGGVCFSVSEEDAEITVWNAAQSATVNQGVEELLITLQNFGVRTAVVSNLSFSAKTLFKRICKYVNNAKFEGVYTSSDEGFLKPDEKIFRQVKKRLNIATHSTVWYIGDSYQNDVIGAKAAAFTPVFYDKTAEKTEFSGGVLTVRSFFDLIALLKALYAE